LGNTSFTCASALDTTQRWFGVWIPPDAIPDAARTRNGRSILTISSCSYFFATAAAVPTLCTTKPVSGGELKLVLSRSMLPSWLCDRSRNAAAIRMRAPTSVSP